MTLLVAAKGGHKLPQVKDGIEEVNESLRYLQSISSKKTLVIKSLWLDLRFIYERILIILI